MRWYTVSLPIAEARRLQEIAESKGMVQQTSYVVWGNLEVTDSGVLVLRDDAGTVTRVLAATEYGGVVLHE